MTEEKTQALLEYLHFLGFESSRLEQDIKSNILSRDPLFNISHEILFAKEKVWFNLKFERDHQFDGYRLQEYEATYFDEFGRTRTTKHFTPSHHGICNSNLAYHIVSGRFDDLIDKISTLNLGEFPGVNPIPNLEKFLSKNANEFTLTCSRNEPEGYIEYKIPISKIYGWYTLNTYTAVLTPNPDVEHGVFNDINTRELENEMKKVDWNNDRELFVMGEDEEPKLLMPAADIFTKMSRLSEHERGANVAEILKLKYWGSTPFLEAFIEPKTWEYASTFPQKEHQFPAEIEAKAAFNLLCGRAILFDDSLTYDKENNTWLRVVFNKKTPDDNTSLKYIKGYSPKDIEVTLNLLPPSENSHQTILRELLIGSQIRFIHPSGKTILLQANPEQKKIDFFTEDLRPINVNLEFDPDWKPIQSSELKPIRLKGTQKERIIKPDKNSGYRRKR